MKKAFRTCRYEQHGYGIFDIEVYEHHERIGSSDSFIIRMQSNHDDLNRWYGVSFEVRYAHDEQVFKFASRLIKEIKEARIESPKRIIDFLESKKFTWIEFNKQLDDFIEVRRFKSEGYIYQVELRNERGLWSRDRIITNNDAEAKKYFRKLAGKNITDYNASELWGKWVADGLQVENLGEVETMKLEGLEVYNTLAEIEAKEEAEA